MVGQTSALFWVFSKDCTMRRAVQGFSRVLHWMITVSFWCVSFILAHDMYYSVPVNPLNIHCHVQRQQKKGPASISEQLSQIKEALSDRGRMRISQTGALPLAHLMPLVYYWSNFKISAHLPTLGQTCYTRETMLLAGYEPAQLILDSSLEVITLFEKCTKTEERPCPCKAKYRCSRQSVKPLDLMRRWDETETKTDIFQLFLRLPNHQGHAEIFRGAGAQF